jgi:phosphoglycerol transferase
MNNLTLSYLFWGLCTSLLILVTFWRTSRKTRIISLTIWACTSFVTLINYIIWEFTGKGFNESIPYHLRFGIEGASISDFHVLIITVILVLITLLLIIFFYSKLMIHSYSSSDYFFFVPLFQLLLLIFHPLFLDIKETYSDQVVSTIPFEKYFYEQPKTITPTKGYNLVWIYAESLERTYLNDTLLPGLMPEITKLETKSLSFTNVHQVYGTGWTIGGIVSSHCGIPLTTLGLKGNDIDRMKYFLPEVKGLGDILSENGYELLFMQGSSSKFAGTKNYLSTHKIKLKAYEELQSQVINSENNGWGITDDVLLNFAREEFSELNKKGKPFALMLSTINTHAPDGVVPRDCKNRTYQDGKISILNAVHCSDSLIGAFVRDIRKADSTNNTIIVVSSDHLSFKNNAYKFIEKGKRRNLLIYNLPGKIIPEKSNKKACMFDAGVTTMHLCGIPITKVGLGRSLISNEKTFMETFPVEYNDILKGWKNKLNQFWYPPKKNNAAIQ